MIRTTLRTVASVIAARKEFKGSNMHGKNVARYCYTKNTDPHSQLPVEYQQQLMADNTKGDTYIVYSYQTPIAWCANGRWTVPNVKYSQSTTRQQSKLPSHNSIAM